MTRRAAATLVAVLGFVAAGACTPSGQSAAAVRVFAAASLTEPVTRIARAFESAYPGCRVELHLAGSSQLALQLREGARADVFAPADEPNLQKVADLGLLTAPPDVLATNRLAVIVAEGNPRGVRGIADLAREDLRVALCGPEVPAGRYARLALQRARVAVRSRSDESNVRALVTKVLLGELDACIAFATDARGKGLEGLALDPAHDVAATYPIAALGCGENGAGGRDFVAFARGPIAREILLQSGFTLP